jgi:hypothetical protein
MSLRNLVIMSLMRFLQGKRGMYYCGTFTTPEGGHDLSFMSGLVAARAVGAPYPFPHDNAEAVADFNQMQRMMLRRGARKLIRASVAAGDGAKAGAQDRGPSAQRSRP